MAQPNLPLTRQPDDKQANVRNSEGAGTTILTATDSKWQIFNLSAARTCQLPSAGIKAGDAVRLENRGAFDLSVASSNGTIITDSNFATASTGIPTIQIGIVELEALQDAPTTPAHWRVMDVYERYVNITGTSSGALAVGFTLLITRRNKVMTMVYNSANAVATATPSVTTGNVLPSRFYHASATLSAPCSIYPGGQIELGFIVVNTTGSIDFRRYNSTNWGSTSGLTAGTAHQYTTSWISDFS